MMIKATISNDALRTRIQALRKTSANTLVSTTKFDADALEELLRLRTAVKLRRVRVVQSGTCDCEAL
jgi:ribosomal protein L18E